MKEEDVFITVEPPIGPKKFAQLIGVSVKTLQRWDGKGILFARRSPTNRRFYTYAQYLEYMGKDAQESAKVYAPVRTLAADNEE